MHPYAGLPGDQEIIKNYYSLLINAAQILKQLQVYQREIVLMMQNGMQ